MANNFVTPSMIADTALMYLDNMIKIGSTVNRQYDKDFKDGKGATINVRKPPKYTVQDGPALASTQSINQGKVPVTVDNWKSVALKLDGIDLAVNKDAYKDWAKDVIEPAASQLANVVEVALASLYKKVYNWVGTPGTPPASFDAIAAAGELLTYNACPDTERYAMLNPTAWRKLGSGLTTLYNPQGPIGELVTSGKVPQVAGFGVLETQNIQAHTVGAYGGTSVVAGASQVGSSIASSGWTASAAILKEGDVITLDGVYLVNPVTKQATSILQEFVVTQNVTADGSGLATIPISPSIITSGAFQTVSASAANLAAITVKTGTASTAYAQNLAYHRSAFGLVTVPVVAPPGLSTTTRSYKGYSVTVTHGPDIMNFTDIWRLDILFGTVVFYPELACRITN